MTFKWFLLPSFAGLFEIARNGVQSIPFKIRFAELLLRSGAPFGAAALLCRRLELRPSSRPRLTPPTRSTWQLNRNHWLDRWAAAGRNLARHRGDRGC